MKLLASLRDVEETTFLNNDVPYNIFVKKELPDKIPDDLFTGELYKFLVHVQQTHNTSLLPYARDIVENKKKNTYRLKGMRNTTAYKRFVKDDETFESLNVFE